MNPEEAHYIALKGTIERSGKKVNDFNDAELETFFQANKADIEKLRVEETINPIRENYAQIKQTLRKYIDTAEENYALIALWIIGTYTHSAFSSYPYLFFNAMKGSGKSRTIKLIVSLSNKGRLITDLTDAVLFRTANGSTLGIDEFENIATKEKATLRTLLNAAYKRGVKVQRMTKIKNKEGEKMVAEEFELFAAIVMANINGVDDVLSDRCITIIQERSTNSRINRLIEDFENDLDIRELKEKLSVNLVKLVQLVLLKDVIKEWNEYVNVTESPVTPQTTQTPLITPTRLKVFDKIYQSNIQGRHIELFFPLFILASLIGEEVFDGLLLTATNIISNKKNDDMTESRDVALIGFISGRLPVLDFVAIRELTRQFKEYMQEEDEQYQTITPKWMGRALKRLGLLIDKRRLGRGIEVIVNSSKAKEKIELFKRSEMPADKFN